jgi:hypothetical protein
MLGTRSCLTARADFASIRQEAAQHVILLVINLYVIDTERANFGATKPTATTTTATFITIIIIAPIITAGRARRAAGCFPPDRCSII